MSYTKDQKKKLASDLEALREKYIKLSVDNKNRGLVKGSDGSRVTVQLNVINNWSSEVFERVENIEGLK